MFIGALEKLTLTDYPGKTACIVFLRGCNFRCPFCYNPELIDSKHFKKSKKQLIPEEEFFSFLQKNKKMLDGVVITGGEPTTSIGLIQFIKKIRSLGFKVKLDTNGSKPDLLKEIIQQNLVDYIAMDIKAPLEKYAYFSGSKISPTKIKESITIISSSSIPHEFRTTLYPKLCLQDIVEIAKLVPNQKLYLQQFLPKKTLSPYAKKLKPMKLKKIMQIVESAKKFADVEYRG